MWIECLGDPAVLNWPLELLKKRGLPIRHIKPFYKSDLRVRER
jgi:hypothetical protein